MRHKLHGYGSGLGLFLFFSFATLTSLAHADTAALRELAEQPTVSFADMISVLAQFNQASPQSDFESQKAFLQQKGFLSKRLAAKKAEEVIRKGDLAEAVIKSLGVQGGLMLRVVDPWSENFLGYYLLRRYALREAVFLELISEGDMQSIVSGLELLSTASKMAEYQSND